MSASEADMNVLNTAVSCCCTLPCLFIQSAQLQIQLFLRQLAPPSNAKWGDLRMGVGVYVGSSAYLIDNFLCANDNCWQRTINMITLNDTVESHNVSR